MLTTPIFTLDELFGDARHAEGTKTRGAGPGGQIPLTAEMLLNEPSGNVFALTQNAGMGWAPERVAQTPYLILSTHGGLRGEDGAAVALGYHTGHWEVNLLVREAAEQISRHGGAPFAGYCTDPCDGRSQGTEAMFDSLPYRNDAAVVLRRLIRSLPKRAGVLGVATCDKGLPAMMLALAGSSALPGVIVPGGVTLPAEGAEDLGTVQTLGARFAHNMVSLDYAATMGCRACGSAGGGCQFLGTAATSQVVAEAMGLSLPHSALCPSGQAVWLDMAGRSAKALMNLSAAGLPVNAILTDRSVRNAMLVHAAFGGSTNLLLHIPAIAHAAGLARPSVEDWIEVSRATPRLVDALPNGPRNFPTVQVFLAGGVPEVMLHLRQMGLLDTQVLTATGATLDESLDWWAQSERRRSFRALLGSADQIDPDDVIMDADTAKSRGMTGTVVFPVGNIAPHGSVVKATAIDPSRVDGQQVYRHRGPARVFTAECDAVMAVKGMTDPPIKAGDVVVMIGMGPAGTGMEETYQVTAALKFVPWGKRVAVVTDARFSGVSTGACLGHVGPEALAGGPIGKLRDGDLIEIMVDQANLVGQVNFLGPDGQALDDPEQAAAMLAQREPHPGLAPHPKLPDDTRLWAALQQVSGGTWAGCVYDVDRIIRMLEAGSAALGEAAAEDASAKRA